MRMMMVAILGLAALSCDRGEPPRSDSVGASVERVRDLVCGMAIEKSAATRLVHDGAPYYFCNDECVRKFQANPGKHAVPCSCGRTSAECPCGHCGHHHDPCDCRK